LAEGYAHIITGVIGNSTRSGPLAYSPLRGVSVDEGFKKLMSWRRGTFNAETPTVNG